MAVDPDLQVVAENAIVHPTLTVVTNARLDHTDAQGGTPGDIAKGFPVRAGGTLVTSDPLVADVHRAHLEAEGGSVHVARAGRGHAADPAGMRYLEHPENLALALEVARLAGVASGAAARGLREAEPDPGVASVIDVPDPTGAWTLVNLFAANDPE